MQGCAGVGIVNALEVVHAFPGREGLAAFRAWVESPDVGVAAAARSLAGEEAGDGEAMTIKLGICRCSSAGSRIWSQLTKPFLL